MHQLDAVLRDQSGVVARRQAMSLGLGPADLARLVRRRELAGVHPGVYVDHTGPLTWHQRAWAAVLFSWPSALSHESALRADEGPGRRERDECVIHVAVDRSRHVSAPEGVRVHRMAGFRDRVRWNVGPPRVRYEEAVLDVAIQATDRLGTVAVLADACGARRTTAARLLTLAEGRPRVADRDWVVKVLADVAAGTCSVLEHGYSSRVERRHRLPRGVRQASHRHRGSKVYRDVDHPRFGVVIELDGRLFHGSTTARDRDLERDLDAAIEGSETIRLSYGQVFDRPCLTAHKIAAVLQRRGWRGRIRRCPDCAAQSERGSFDE